MWLGRDSGEEEAEEEEEEEEMQRAKERFVELDNSDLEAESPSEGNGHHGNVPPNAGLRPLPQEPTSSARQPAMRSPGYSLLSVLLRRK